MIDPKGKQPVTVVEVVGPPTEDLARGIAARAILGCSPVPPDSPALQAVADRLVAKVIDDRFLRWVVGRLHSCFGKTDGWALDGYEIQVAEYSPDGVVVAFCQISRKTGHASPLPSKYVLITARPLEGLCLNFG
jgi:hypothetical protein